MNNDYTKINNRTSYNKLLKSGMFFEFYPELSGVYIKDIEIINKPKDFVQPDLSGSVKTSPKSCGTCRFYGEICQGCKGDFSEWEPA